MNLHYETVSPLLKETLQKLVNSPIFKDFGKNIFLFLKKQFRFTPRFSPISEMVI